MHLSRQDSAAFFNTWTHIEAFLNRSLRILPGVTLPAHLRGASLEGVVQLRGAVWQDPGLLDAFVAANPFQLSAQELEDVPGFKRAVHGLFFVERCLKDHAVFIAAGDEPKVYAVQGLTEPVGDVLQRVSGTKRGVLVQTTILPYRGRLIWDGLVAQVNMTLGANMQRAFKETYEIARQNGSILAGSQTAARAAAKPAKDWSPELNAISNLAATLGKPASRSQAAAFKLLKAAAQLAVATGSTATSLDDLDTLLKTSDRALGSLVDAINSDANS